MTLALLVLLCAQDKPTLGSAFADGETFKVELHLKTRATEKEKVVFELEHTGLVSCTAKKKGDALLVEARFSKFTFTGKGGTKDLAIAWEEPKKIEEVDWSGGEALRDLVKSGFTFSVDGAGNASGCSEENERYLLMTIEPLLAGSGAVLPGDAHSAGDAWEKTTTSGGAEITWSNKYEKDEEAAAIVSSSFVLKDKQTKGVGDGKGTGRTKVDRKTGRALEGTATLDITGGGQSLHFEATSRVIK